MSPFDAALNLFESRVKAVDDALLRASADGLGGYLCVREGVALGIGTVDGVLMLTVRAVRVLDLDNPPDELRDGQWTAYRVPKAERV